MGREALIECFNDTVLRSQTGELKTLTEKAVSSACVYRENFSASHSKRQNLSEDDKSKICVVSGTTFETAQKYIQFGRTAVLNFANPQYPGEAFQRALWHRKNVCAEAVICTCA